MSDETLKKNAQTLRRNATTEENKLWYQFLRTYPVQFHRQKVVGKFIVDFYCHNARLVVEIDGGHHFEEAAIRYDDYRSRYLSVRGLEVIRFSNFEVRDRFDAVCACINEKVRSRIK